MLKRVLHRTKIFIVILIFLGMITWDRIWNGPFDEHKAIWYHYGLAKLMS